MGVPLWKTVYLDSDLALSLEEEDDGEDPNESQGFILSEEELLSHNLDEYIPKVSRNEAGPSRSTIEEVDLTLDDDSVEIVYEDANDDENQMVDIEYVKNEDDEPTPTKRPRKSVGFFMEYIYDDIQKPRFKNKRGKPPPNSTNQKKFKCPQCDVYFTRKNNIKSHLRIHTGEKPFTCVECGKSFTRKDTFNRHSCKY